MNASWQSKRTAHLHNLIDGAITAQSETASITDIIIARTSTSTKENAEIASAVTGTSAAIMNEEKMETDGGISDTAAHPMGEMGLSTRAR